MGFAVVAIVIGFTVVRRVVVVVVVVVLTVVFVLTVATTGPGLGVVVLVSLPLRILKKNWIQS